MIHLETSENFKKRHVPILIYIVTVNLVRNCTTGNNPVITFGVMLMTVIGVALKDIYGINLLYTTLLICVSSTDFFLNLCPGF